MSNSSGKQQVLVAGGGIGGLAAALALVRQGFEVKVLEQSPETATTVIAWLGQPLLVPYHAGFAVGDTVSWMVPEAAVVLVREHQSDRENTVAACVSERLAWRGHATVSARVAGRRDATLSFAIGASVAQRRGIIPGASILLQLQKSAVRLLPAEEASRAPASGRGDVSP